MASRTVLSKSGSSSPKTFQQGAGAASLILLPAKMGHPPASVMRKRICQTTARLRLTTPKSTTTVTDRAKLKTKTDAGWPSFDDLSLRHLQSRVPYPPFAKNAKDGAPHCIGDASEINILGHSPPARARQFAIIAPMADQGQTIEAKTARLESVKEKVRQFVDSGGDLKSSEAVPLGVELLQTYDALAREFGYQILKPIKDEKTTESPNTEALLKLFAFDKKRELEKYCRDLIIHSRDFANFILACEFGSFPFLHQIHYRDHVPDDVHLTDRDLAALSANPVGPLEPGAQKTVRKIGQMFKVRRYLV